MIIDTALYGVVGECWEWAGTRSRDGYGTVRVSQCAGLMERTAHRWAWVMANGAIPEGMCVCHRCDNPPCIRPDHLFLGSHMDNMRDAITKGRRPSVVSGSRLKSACRKGHPKEPGRPCRECARVRQQRSRAHLAREAALEAKARMVAQRSVAGLASWEARKATHQGFRPKDTE